MSDKKLKKSSSQSKLENNNSSHYFKHAGNAGMTACAECGKFVWKKGVKCQVCNLLVHQKCEKNANKSTSCNTTITNTKNLMKFKKKSVNAKLKSLNALSEAFIEIGVASATKINTFIVMLSSDYDRLIDSVDFECFEKCSTSQVNLKAHLSVNGVSDGLELLRNYINYTGIEPSDAIIASIASEILKRLLVREDTRVQLLNSNFLSDIARSLELNLQHRTFSYYMDILEIIFNTLSESEEHMDYFFSHGSVDTVVNFCLELQKIKTKDINKEDRKAFENTKLAGAKLVSLYYQVGNREFQRYIEQKNALPVFLEFIMTNQIHIHHEVKPEDAIQVETVYSSPLCEVFKGTYRHLPVAIKQFDIDKYFFEEEFYKEIGLLTILQAPCVVKFYGAHTLSSRPFILLDYFENGSLEDVTNTAKREELGITVKLTTSLIANFALNAGLGISHLHSKNIVHRDIKAANFLVDLNYNVKIIDFGVSRVKAEDGLKMTCVGTPVWMAPEVIKGDLYTQQADVYSFALLIWSMLTGHNPYEHIDPLSLVMEVAIEGYREDIPEHADETFVKIIETARVENAQERPSMEELISLIYDMEDGASHYRTHAHDNLKDEEFFPILERLDLTSLGALSSASRRFSHLISPILATEKPDHSDSSEVETERFGTVSAKRNHATSRLNKR